MGTFSNNSIEGEVYVQRLASHVRHNEEALANGLLSFSKSRSGTKVKPLRLSFTLHHLYYIIEKIDSSPWDVDVGPLNIKLDNPNHEPTFISFMATNARSKKFESDTRSITSMNSVKSIVSSASVYFRSVGFTRDPKVVHKDLKYLYSSFTKLPCLILTPKTKINSISQYEEYPCDTSVPMKMFKNLQVLEIIDYEPNEVYGWDELSERLRILVIKNSKISDIAEVLFDLVIDDENGRTSYSSYSTPRKYSQDSIVMPPLSPALGGISENSVMGGSLPQESSWGKFRESTTSLTSAGTHSYGSYHHYGHYHTHHKSVSSVTQSTGGSLDNTTLPGRKWALLKQLTISETSITSIPPHVFKPFKALVKLNLSHNLLDKIPEGLDQMTNLRYLNLSDNYIESLEGLPNNLHALTTLNVSNNRLKDLDGLERMVSLEKLDVRRNRLEDIRSLRGLVSHYMNNDKLLDVYLSGNKLSKGYRLELFNLYNGIRYKNNLKIDDSRPGYFESAMLLDSENALRNFQKYMEIIPETSDRESLLADVTVNDSDNGDITVIEQLASLNLDTTRNRSGGGSSPLSHIEHILNQPSRSEQELDKMGGVNLSRSMLSHVDLVGEIRAVK